VRTHLINSASILDMHDSFCKTQEMDFGIFVTNRALMTVKLDGHHDVVLITGNDYFISEDPERVKGVSFRGL
jgi:hypothetical protein